MQLLSKKKSILRVGLKMCWTEINFRDIKVIKEIYQIILVVKLQQDEELRDLKKDLQIIWHPNLTKLKQKLFSYHQEPKYRELLVELDTAFY